MRGISFPIVKIFYLTFADNDIIGKKNPSTLKFLKSE